MFEQTTPYCTRKLFSIPLKSNRCWSVLNVDDDDDDDCDVANDEDDGGDPGGASGYSNPVPSSPSNTHPFRNCRTLPSFLDRGVKNVCNACYWQRLTYMWQYASRFEVNTQ